MAAESLPRAFALIEQEPNTAADAALLDVLPSLEPREQAADLSILIRRAHPPSLAGIVGRFHTFDATLRDLVAACAGDLATTLGGAIASTLDQDQANAIQIIADSRQACTASLLASALRSRAGTTRNRAAEILLEWTERLSSTSSDAKTGESCGRSGDRKRDFDHLAEALIEAIRRWESHRHPDALRAAVRLSDHMVPAIQAKLQERRTTIGPALRRTLEQTADPHAAGFVMCALAIPELRAAAVNAITRAEDGAFLAALAGEFWRLEDRNIQKGCHWVRIGPWCERLMDLLPKLDTERATGVVRFLMTIGGSTDQKNKLIGELIGGDSAEVRRAVVQRLIDDRSEIANRWLILLASRPGSPLAKPASMELRRRRRNAANSPAAPADRDANVDDTFEECWATLDELCAEQAPHDAASLRDRFPELRRMIENKLKSPHPYDRARALRLAVATDLVEDLDDAVRRLAHDPDPVVRSSAFGILDRLPGRTTERLIRMAVNDSDARVQANAIEILDKFDAADRKALTEPKLASSNGRIRANAIKSLLRLDLPAAGEALLDMLEDRSAAHRLSALWVVQRLRLSAASRRLEKLVRYDPSTRVRRKAHRILGELGGQPDSVAPQFQDASNDSAARTMGARS